MKSISLFLLFIVVSCNIANAQITIGDYTIFADPANHGTPYELDENRINLVFLAEGYTGELTGSTYNDYPYFEAHKSAIVHRMFEPDNITGLPIAVPLNRYRDYFNIFWVWVKSDNSGAGCRTSSTNGCGIPNTTVHQSGFPCYQQVDNYFG